MNNNNDTIRAILSRCPKGHKVDSILDCKQYANLTKQGVVAQWVASGPRGGNQKWGFVMADGSVR